MRGLLPASGGGVLRSGAAGSESRSLSCREVGDEASWCLTYVRRFESGPVGSRKLVARRRGGSIKIAHRLRAGGFSLCRTGYRASNSDLSSWRRFESCPLRSTNAVTITTLPLQAARFLSRVAYQLVCPVEVVECNQSPASQLIVDPARFWPDQAVALDEASSPAAIVWPHD